MHVPARPLSGPVPDQPATCQGRRSPSLQPGADPRNSSGPEGSRAAQAGWMATTEARAPDTTKLSWGKRPWMTTRSGGGGQGASGTGGWRSTGRPRTWGSVGPTRRPLRSASAQTQTAIRQVRRRAFLPAGAVGRHASRGRAIPADETGAGRDFFAGEGIWGRFLGPRTRPDRAGPRRSDRPGGVRGRARIARPVPGQRAA